MIATQAEGPAFKYKDSTSIKDIHLCYMKQRWGNKTFTFSTSRKGGVIRKVMASAKEIDSQLLVEKAAEKLREMPGMEKPEWARFVKTGVSRERPPDKEGWWWIRGASILRKVYLQGQGVSKLRKAYSGRKHRGHKPERHRIGSGKIVRTLLKQLEARGFVKTEKGKGRVITPAGQKFLDGIAKDLKKS